MIALRVLCVGETWDGSDARASFAALRRQGNDVQVLDDNHYGSNQWRTFPGRGIRKVFRPILVNELRLACMDSLEQFRPHCLFVFKGNWLHPSVLHGARERGVIAVNYYPDVSFLSHGPYIPRTLPLYDHVFTTKSYGIADMDRELGVKRASYLPLGFDPDLHAPRVLDADDRRKYECDVAFVGTWSPKKERLIASLRRALPGIVLRVWGTQWEKCRSAELAASIQGHGVVGTEYVKSLCGAKICLGLLSEKGEGATSGDLITARTFQIPACGSFMLHERNPEALSYFEEGRDAAFFESPEELVQKVGYYLERPGERQSIGANGLQRARRDHAIDNRIAVITAWLQERIRHGREAG